MDKTLRNQLYNTVVKCRRLLEEDLTQQLEGSYGIHAGSTFEPLDGLSRLDAVGRAEREEIEAAIRHEELAINRAAGTGKAGRREAVARTLRESAFTLLNRLAAFKLMEHPSRALIQPSLGQKEAHLIALADLGYGVLDTAMVETAAYVLEKREEANL